MGKSIAVFKTIKNEKWSDNERVEALCAVADMPTLNSITKYELQTALKWLVDRAEWVFDDNTHDNKEVQEDA